MSRKALAVGMSKPERRTKALYLALAASGRLIAGFSLLIIQQGYLKRGHHGGYRTPGIMLIDAYASQTTRITVAPIAGFCAILVLSTNSELALPSFRMILLGSLAGMLLVGALRLYFAPDDHRTTGA